MYIVYDGDPDQAGPRVDYLGFAPTWFCKEQLKEDELDTIVPFKHFVHKSEWPELLSSYNVEPWFPAT